MARDVLRTKMIDALECGASVPMDRWSGKVASVQVDFINLLHPDGYIVSLLSDPGHMHPFGIMVPSIDFSSLPVRPGLAASSENGLLKIADEFAVSIVNAHIWTGEVASCPEVFFDVALLSALKAAIAEHAGPEGFGCLATAGGLNRFALRAAALIKDASSRRELMDFSGLIGLGIGLTPSGDDFLTGALLAQEAGERCVGGEIGPLLDRKAIHSSLHKTNASGRTLLLGALSGRFPAYLLRLWSALCAAGEERQIEVSSAVGEASRHGATSGVDSCTGLWWYLDRLSRTLFS